MYFQTEQHFNICLHLYFFPLSFLPSLSSPSLCFSLLLPLIPFSPFYLCLLASFSLPLFTFLSSSSPPSSSSPSLCPSLAPSSFYLFLLFSPTTSYFTFLSSFPPHLLPSLCPSLLPHLFTSVSSSSSVYLTYLDKCTSSITNLLFIYTVQFIYVYFKLFAVLFMFKVSSY